MVTALANVFASAVLVERKEDIHLEDEVRLVPPGVSVPVVAVVAVVVGIEDRGGGVLERERLDANGSVIRSADQVADERGHASMGEDANHGMPRVWRTWFVNSSLIHGEGSALSESSSGKEVKKVNVLVVRLQWY